MPLTPTERSYLCQLADRAIRAAVEGTAVPDPADVAKEAGVELTPALQEERGAFVTLTRDGNLRGCIGYIEGIKPLVEAVIDNGAAAATGDPRFEPVTAAELDQLEIEVSALTPLVEVDGPDDIEIGRHGIHIEKGSRRAVFLPQVATEQGWNINETLIHLCLKAQLPSNGWRMGCTMKVFEAEICPEP